MKKFLVLILAGVMLLAACAPADATAPVAPATEPPTQVIIVTPPPAPNTATPTPEICPPGWYVTPDGCARAFVPPTPVVGNNIVVLGGELPSIIFITVDGEAYGCLQDKCQFEQVIGEDLPESVMYAFFFSEREGENTIAFIGGNPTKVWYDNGGILTCTDPCRGEFEIMNNYEFEDGLMALNDSGQVAAKDAIKFWRDKADTGNACIPSGEAVGLLSYCVRTLVTPTP